MNSDARELRSLLGGILDSIPDSRETAILLSGGLDSSALACILLRNGRGLRSISASFPGYAMYDETQYVEIIKEKYIHLETDYFNPLHIDLLHELNELIAIIEEPISSGSALLHYLIMKKAKHTGIKNLIYGQWADELMGGYDGFLLAVARDDFQHLKVSDTIMNIVEYYHRSKMVGTDRILLRIAKGLLVKKGLRTELNRSIPNVKHLVDMAEKMARALDINLIIPFEDSKIAEFCQSLGSDRLVHRGETKIILKEAVADLVPKGILERRRKLGFVAPDIIWLLENKDRIRRLEDKAVEKELRKALNNPQRRWHKKLWFSLSSAFLSNGKV